MRPRLKTCTVCCKSNTRGLIIQPPFHMQTIKTLYQKLEALDTDQVIVNSLEQTKEEIANLNVEQMNKGFNSKGEKIGAYRNELYAEEKHRMNPLPGFGVPDLRLTGAFYGGTTVKVSGQTLMIDSSDSKSIELQEKYGKEIFGLSGVYKREYLNESLGPVFRKSITSIIGLKFSGK
jgi:hypothetical protein